MNKFFEFISYSDAYDQINGRLLALNEGCGLSIAGIRRIVGGKDAVGGSFPWMALLAYKFSGYKLQYDCGKCNI